MSHLCEITNPGDLHFGITPEKLTVPHESKPWNPIIANVFYRAGIIERWGSGTLNIMDWCKENANPIPNWHEQAGSVYVTFLPAVLPEGAQADPPSTPHVTPHVAPQVIRLLSVLKEGGLTRSLSMEKLGLRDRKSFRIVYLQPALENGLIEMTQPDSPKSPTQEYRLTAKGETVLKGKEVEQ